MILIHTTQFQSPVTRAKTSRQIYLLLFSFFSVIYKLKVLYARPPMLLIYRPCFLLAQASLFCQHLKHTLWWLPQEVPGGLKRREARNCLCQSLRNRLCESHSAGQTSASGLQGFEKYFMCHLLLPMG